MQSPAQNNLIPARSQTPESVLSGNPSLQQLNHPPNVSSQRTQAFGTNADLPPVTTNQLYNQHYQNTTNINQTFADFQNGQATQPFVFSGNPQRPPSSFQQQHVLNANSSTTSDLTNSNHQLRVNSFYQTGSINSNQITSPQQFAVNSPNIHTNRNPILNSHPGNHLSSSGSSIPHPAYVGSYPPSHSFNSNGSNLNSLNSDQSDETTILTTLQPANVACSPLNTYLISHNYAETATVSSNQPSATIQSQSTQLSQDNRNETIADDRQVCNPQIVVKQNAIQNPN